MEHGQGIENFSHIHAAILVIYKSEITRLVVPESKLDSGRSGFLADICRGRLDHRQVTYGAAVRRHPRRMRNRSKRQTKSHIPRCRRRRHRIDITPTI